MQYHFALLHQLAFHLPACFHHLSHMSLLLFHLSWFLSYYLHLLEVLLIASLYVNPPNPKLLQSAEEQSGGIFKTLSQLDTMFWLLLLLTGPEVGT